MNVFRLLGWNVKCLRRSKGFTQEELAFRTGGIDQAYISELEHGKANPTLQLVFAISLALEVKMSELFALETAPPDIINSGSERDVDRNVLK